MVEIVSTQFTVNGDLYGNTQIPRNVSLHLYEASGHLFILPQWIEKRLMIPEYVDHHISELILYKIATETGYVPVADPPNWDKCMG
ncbi:hypothetical protein JOY44_26185 (plasmid) [Phormidium sp. CLA17]|uniref:hypothetical protein n=1 Tax=Leptolyngbya sp. Cla-17 TaxID=2803751 RepID=UPI001491EE59|nr:hypothetical protein [Leptolyngbya sp. Cla-17]MBM0745012.1 hypothetical protein [Leptolyngbya sp. Cla-17]